MNTLTAPTPPAAPTQATARPIVLRTRGRGHGPIVRLVSPSDVGQLIKPFVFLDAFEFGPDRTGMPYHPHSGIATLTLLIEGALGYEDTTGAAGVMRSGAVEWMRAGKGVWHTGTVQSPHNFGFQLWVALPPALETAPALSQYLGPEAFGQHGPARVILGQLGDVSSPIAAPAPMNYLAVELAPGETWRYDPPAGHDVAWLCVYKGALVAPDTIRAGELVVFEEGDGAIVVTSVGTTAFVLGSAVKHPHDMVMGNYSVHTNAQALQTGEAEIARIGMALHRAGKR